ncbi:MAG: hypothetical protein ABR985_11375 [Methanotrichaceae archaeon]|jgi:hypothetical protein
MFEEKETIEISDRMERAILESFKKADQGILPRKAIVTIVQKSIDSPDSTIAQRIRKLIKYGYLIKISRGIYKANPKKSFVYRVPLPSKLEPYTVLEEARKKHSADLKEAIQIWRANLPEPSQCYTSFGWSSSQIAVCESHVLFPDLVYHLSIAGSDIYDMWTNYKKDFHRLDELKETLRSSLEAEIRGCFEGMKLTFDHYDENCLTEDYESLIDPLTLYDVAINLDSEEGDCKYNQFLSWLQCNSPIIEKGDHVQWGRAAFKMQDTIYIRVPMKDRHLLEAGVKKFMVFFEDLCNSRFMTLSIKIEAKVESLKSEREKILKELERILYYTSFPGECQYLGD